MHIPAFKGRRHQLTGQETKKSRITANERIHVERVIGKMKKKLWFCEDLLKLKIFDPIPKATLLSQKYLLSVAAL